MVKIRARPGYSTILSPDDFGTQEKIAVRPGLELEVSDTVWARIQEMCAPGGFEVLEEEKPKAKASAKSRKKGGRRA